MTADSLPVPGGTTPPSPELVAAALAEVWPSRGKHKAEECPTCAAFEVIAGALSRLPELERDARRWSAVGPTLMVRTAQKGGFWWLETREAVCYEDVIPPLTADEAADVLATRLAGEERPHESA